MARYYGTKIKNGEMTIEEIHPYWKAKTEEWLANNA